MILLCIGLAAFVFSLYQLFIANDAITLGAGILRVIIALLTLVGIRFQEPMVLTTAVFLYAIISMLVLAIIRNEVQIKND
jgi:hypothetical protein